MRCSKGLNVLVAAVVYSSFLSVTAAAEEPHHAASKTAASSVEEIYVVRSWRESRAPAVSPPIIKAISSSHHSHDRVRRRRSRMTEVFHRIDSPR